MSHVLQNRYRLHLASYLDTSAGSRCRERLGKRWDELRDALLHILAGDLGLPPDEIHGEHVALLVADLLPARLSGTDSTVDSELDCIESFLMHVLDEEGLARQFEWQSAMEHAAEDFRSAMSNADRGRLSSGPSKPHKRPGTKLGRNDPCPCGSGKKYKKCCGK